MQITSVKNDSANKKPQNTQCCIDKNDTIMTDVPLGLSGCTEVGDRTLSHFSRR